MSDEALIEDVFDDPEQIYARRDDESAKWYHRFCEYLALGPGRRSVRAVYAKERGLATSKSVPASWSAAYHRFEWARRAETYDARRREVLFAQGNASDVERIKKLDMLIDELYTQSMARLAEMSADKVAATFLAALELMAKHTGMAENHRHEISGKDGAPIEVEASMKAIFYLPEVAPDPMAQLSDSESEEA